MRGKRLKFQRLFRMSKAAISRETADWPQLRAISMKMSALMKIIDTDRMAEKSKKRAKNYVKCVTT
jgi:hypothetical protein